MYIARRMTAFLVRRGIIAEDRRTMEIYEYGLELISGDLINFAVVLLLSALLQNIGTGVLYLLCFVSVRLFSGGFHAKTHFRCGLAMAVFYLLFSVIYQGLSAAGTEVLSAGTALAYIPVAVCIPVVNRNRPLNDAERRTNRKRAIILYVLWTMLAVLLVFFGMEAGKVILSTLWIISINIIFARYVQFWEGRERDEKDY